MTLLKRFLFVFLCFLTAPSLSAQIPASTEVQASSPVYVSSQTRAEALRLKTQFVASDLYFIAVTVDGKSGLLGYNLDCNGIGCSVPKARKNAVQLCQNEFLQNCSIFDEGGLQWPLSKTQTPTK